MIENLPKNDLALNLNPEKTEKGKEEYDIERTNKEGYVNILLKLSTKDVWLSYVVVLYTQYYIFQFTFFQRIHKKAI